MDKLDLPSISIIVPTMGRRGTLRSLLDSLRELEYDPDRIEVIIVDGEKNGEVEKVVSDYPFILVKDEGTGLNKARNIGFKKSSHEIVAFTDDDCVVSRDWALRIAESFSDPSIGFVGGSVMGYNKERILSTYMDETIVPVMPRYREKIVTRSLELLNFPAGCNMAFRRKALEKINLFDERITYGFDDLEPVERIIHADFNIFLNPEVLVLHKHRINLRGFLRQNFRYGRGGMLYLQTRRRSSLSRWIRNYLAAVFLGLIVLSLPLIAALVTRVLLFVVVDFGLLTIPGIILMLLYIRNFKVMDDLKKVLLYPLIDILRGIAFAFGALYQLLISLLRGR